MIAALPPTIEPAVPAVSATTPVPVPPAADVIEVTAARTPATLHIDRRTYQVQQTPQSAQKDTLQLLRGLPAVTITPDDQILLLGAGNARIYVDGHPYAGDARQYLRTLHGSDIARIEVINNPSAQFSAEGTGGVINLVLRQARHAGWSGNASVETSSYGHGLIDTTLHYRRGRWSYELKAGGNIGTMARAHDFISRRVEPDGDGAATAYTRSGQTDTGGTDGRLSGKATYEIDAKTTVSLGLGGGGGHDITHTRASYQGLTPDFSSFAETRRLSSVASFLTGELDVDHRGTREGETLTASVQVYTNPVVRDETLARFSNGGGFATVLRNPTTTIDGQVDWKHPIAAHQLLSLGTSWHRDSTSQAYSLSSEASDGALATLANDRFAGRSTTLAAYATLQQTLGKLTIAPGLRAERSVRRIDSTGEDRLVLGRTAVFPSLHIQFASSKMLTLAASYSQRIERAPLDYLRPYTVVEDPLTLFQGNPALQDQTTASWEGSLQYRRGAIETNLTAYWRTTSNVWSTTYAATAAGASIYGYVNAGRSRSAGAQFDLSAPLLRHVKLSASANLFDQCNPIDVPGGQQLLHTMRASTNGTLEWSGTARGDVPADVAQVQWSYNSPSRAWQVRDAAWGEASMIMTHSFDRTLSLSATLRVPGRTRQELSAPLIQGSSWRQRTTEFQLKLLKTLG
ncbi:outer membrane receptor for ferrienterochelin and colicin [Novosphingobium sp. SG754]|nr:MULTISPECIES: TonB-dependent receptor [unclassified Novosphingobium]MBB3478961.1 outer membrane receptor for ferrienterochelin and colicin [Novosphingobium sp. BK369]MBB3622246.1 outer membrane receptor for ferrienterochelin and colicin [Novosphingobium sp. BK592]NOX06632.1 outer membrane receptor for ferrienterochelin and colicin [Novosphingobium sp. SG754]